MDKPEVNEIYLRQAEATLERGVRPRYVYFLVATFCLTDVDEDGNSMGFDSMVKIGTTIDLESRRKSIMQNIRTKGGPDWLDMGAENCDMFNYVGYVKGDHELEGLLHKAFRDFRVNGEREWFWYEEDVQLAISEILDCYCADPLCAVADLVGVVDGVEFDASWMTA